MASERPTDNKDSLPAPCPQCGKTLETRGDAMVHMFVHVGDGDVSPGGGRDGE